jgi:hypothetical protein
LLRLSTQFVHFAVWVAPEITAKTDGEGRP